MTNDYISREGEATAIDTYTELTTMGSETSPGVPSVPPKASALLGIIAAFACDLVAAAGVTGAIIKLEGAGLRGGIETIALGTNGVEIATGGKVSVPAKFYPLNVSVQPNQPIHIWGQMINEDLGEMNFGVTLVFKVND